ncbi:CO or xanthine dehydrogenase, FAD-binding subunit [Roseovarius azorensis]|uniref:CO or xanthine dehydrogenase, FAD-binding subunit n=1 Tax=Roseovarius azorensis TaxID=1287727 RepID=A0A1H7J3X8_9RHOB|nr:FAD binding domain-containing protein [Roseovarius azorensis]SEK69461.1 CO or xanthine dehydrogenase, FAD-binding subunit [Roseovarius azorensis]
MQAYHRPRTLQDALGALAGGAARVAAGCTDLFPATGARELTGPVVDITRVEELRGVTQGPDGWRFGAATTWADVIRADLPPAFDMLKEAAREVGSVQIQTAGTLAGNICNASPAADGVPCLLALEAEVEIGSVAGTRRVPLAGFITGVRRTVLRPGEMVLALHVPDAAAHGRSRFLKLGARRYLVISIAMVAVRLLVEEGRVSQAAVAVGACSAVARRLARLEGALVGARADETVGRVEAGLVLQDLAPIDDIRADAAYRGTAAVELIRRAIGDLVRA